MALIESRVACSMSQQLIMWNVIPEWFVKSLVGVGREEIGVDREGGVVHDFT